VTVAVGERNWPFSFTDDVRFADLDAMGHLNNVAFLAFLESARVAYVVSADPTHDPGAAGDFGFVVAEAKIAYRSPGHYGERIETRLRPTVVGRSSFRIEFEMRVGQRLLADGYDVTVTYDTATASSTPIPPVLRTRLLADGAKER
jgi:acyl-CoA thioester hydrolase